MNATTKFLLLLIVLACAGFFVKGPGGKPYLSLDALKWWTEKAEEKTPDSGALVRKMETIKEKISEIENPFSKSGGKDVVYKWKDENGVRHFSDTGNPDGDAEIMTHGPENDLIYLDPPQFDDSKPSSSKPYERSATASTDSNSAGESASEPDLKNPIRRANDVRKKVQANYRAIEDLDR